MHHLPPSSWAHAHAHAESTIAQTDPAGAGLKWPQYFNAPVTVYIRQFGVGELRPHWWLA